MPLVFVQVRVRLSACYDFLQSSDTPNGPPEGSRTLKTTVRAPFIMAHTQDNKSDYKLTQNSIKHEQRAPEHLFQVTGQAGTKADSNRRANGSRVEPCALRPATPAPRAQMAASAASSTSSADVKPPARRRLTTCRRVPQLQAVGDHLDG